MDDWPDKDDQETLSLTRFSLIGQAVSGLCAAHPDYPADDIADMAIAIADAVLERLNR